ncbi:MAG: ParB/RepB/Spo0J family partition protein [Mastigocoleus sp. MO_167.B18]|nr:ParB/RepB/Spo0J family partition protein [Mastigocoleus sp. MO_167.B18]
MSAKKTIVKQDSFHQEMKSIDFLSEGNQGLSYYQKVKIDSIVLSQLQVRHYLDPQKQQKLVQSIETHGILENLIVRPIEGTEELFELVAGERRYKAAIAAGLEEVPVKICSLNDEQALQISLIENLQREDLDPVEETEAILQLLASRLQISQSAVSSLLYRMQNDILRMNDKVIIQPDAEVIEQVFNELGLMNWKSFVSNRLPLLKLPAEILDALRERSIVYTKAKAIAKVKNLQFRKELLTEAIEKKLSLSQIREKIKVFQPNYGQLSPQATIESTVYRLKVAQLWKKDPQKWKQIKECLHNIDTLLNEE